MKPKPTRGERIAMKLVQSRTCSIFLDRKRLATAEKIFYAWFVVKRIRQLLAIQIDAAYAAGVRAGKRSKAK